MVGRNTKNTLDLDEIDLRILNELQVDASRPVGDIAAAVGLSANPCWRRIKRLQEEGVIRQRVALLDPTKLGLGITVFVSIRTNQHNKEWFERFAAGVAAMPEIVEFHRMSGEIDYLLKILVADIAAFDAVYKRLVEVVPLFDVSSSFSLEQIKYTTAVPVPSHGRWRIGEPAHWPSGKNKIHHAVIAHEKKVVGIVSSLDLLRLVEGRRFVAKDAPATSKSGRKTKQGRSTRKDGWR